jgi:hypothetical protein
MEDYDDRRPLDKNRHAYARARRQARFLAFFEMCGQVLKASRWAKVPRSEHYRWLEEDPKYPTRFDAADMKFTRRVAPFDAESLNLENLTRG